MRGALEAKAEVQMRKAIQAWLECPAEKRPSCFSLGYRIQEIAMDFTREELRSTTSDMTKNRKSK